MKLSNKEKKIVFISKTSVALIVFNDVDGQHNILYANQLKSEPTDLQANLLKLLTHAANFINCYIKDVEVVFDDPEVANVKYENAEFFDCSSKEDVIKEIYKKATIDNYYINEINFDSIVYDEIDKKAIVNCTATASNYITFANFNNIVKHCNVIVNKSTNLYTLLNSNKTNSELVINIVNNDIYVAKYFDNTLTNVFKIDASISSVKSAIAKKLDIEYEKVEAMCKIANNVISNKNLDLNISLKYDVKTKSFSSLKATDFIAFYQEELFNQINNVVDFKNYKATRIISNSKIDSLANTDFICESETIGLEAIAANYHICLDNITINNKVLSHYEFEKNISKGYDAKVLAA